MSTKYMYDAFGNSSYTGEYSDNLFKYCGEYEDPSLDGIYLRARIYNPGIGRFTTEDPARDELNWYAYCGNNPIAFKDPSGLEQLVVSGGNYGDGFKYNFIEPAIADLRRLIRENKKGETITWLMADEGWTDEDKKHFTTIANGDLKISLRFFSTVDNLIKYLNNGGGNRKNDPITKFIMYSHGFEGCVSFGYDYSWFYNKDLDFNIGDIDRLDQKAFKNPDSRFESCNTGTGGNNKFCCIMEKETGRTCMGLCWTVVIL